MKILQTLGKQSGTTEGIFAYRRDEGGVLIDVTLWKSPRPQPVILTHDEWAEILKHLAERRRSTFRLTGRGPFKTGPKESLYSLLSKAVPRPSNGWRWSDSVKAAVCAILEHEGSVDFYHGVLGRGVSVVICLKPDV